MKEITKRTLTGIIYIGVILAATLISPLVTALIFGVIAALGLWEFYRNVKIAGIKPQILGYVLALLAYLPIFANFLNTDTQDTAMMFSFMAFMIALVYIFVLIIIAIPASFIYELYRKNDNPFNNIAYTFLGVIYVVFPFIFANMIIKDNNFQPMNLLSLFIFIWCNDTFAYLTGCKWGKHRLLERISPKKSWEGFAGGLIATQIAAFVIWLLNNDVPLWHWIALGLIMSIFGTLGDLVESMFKRQAGVKDSGKILPGHGGILDRFDSMLIALPIVFVFMVLEQVLM